MTKPSPILLCLRRELRLADHPALHHAAETGRPVIPVLIRDEAVDSLGAAPKWRLGKGIESFAADLAKIGSRLILRSGETLGVLQTLLTETGAGDVWWTRSYDPAGIARDTTIKATLKAQGIGARSFAGHLLFEPWTVETKTGGFFRVYTPMWKNVRTRTVEPPFPAVRRLVAPDQWPAGEPLTHWGLDAAMDRGAQVLERFARVGEARAAQRLDIFIDSWVADYVANRDLPSVEGTSRLSENLALGEIGPRTCWHAGQRALAEGKAGAETFLKELVWREFAYHLMFHTPHILDQNWRTEWAAFPWKQDPESPEVMRWKQGRTGIDFVDAAMRELYITGTMHNRGRMIVASYLTKHMLCHWKIGMDWFADCLIDWDPASNAMGWQWSAGSGPDATPYFRVFNPVTQLDKFDPKRRYTDRWIAEGRATPSADALLFFAAMPRSWPLKPDAPRPEELVSPAEGRIRALDAYKNRSF